MKLALSYMGCSSTILPSRQRGIINKVKVIKRRAYAPLTGFRDRVLMACRSIAISGTIPAHQVERAALVDAGRRA